MARAFEIILHRGMTGKIYNIGGTNEKANVDVAKDLIRLMGHGKAEEKMLQLEDRAFNGRCLLLLLPFLKALFHSSLISSLLFLQFKP